MKSRILILLSFVALVSCGKDVSKESSLSKTSLLKESSLSKTSLLKEEILEGELITNNREDYVTYTGDILYRMINKSNVMSLPELKNGKFYFLDKIDGETVVYYSLSPIERCLIKTSDERYLVKYSDERIIQITYKKFINSKKMDEGKYTCNEDEHDSLSFLSARYTKNVDDIKSGTMKRLIQRSNVIRNIDFHTPSEGISKLTFSPFSLIIKNESEIKYTLNQNVTYSFFKENYLPDNEPKELSEKETAVVLDMLKSEKTKTILPDGSRGGRTIYIIVTSEVFGFDFQEYFISEKNENNPTYYEIESYIYKLCNFYEW